MRIEDDKIDSSWLLRRRPSAWNTLWLLPLAVALVLGGSWLVRGEDGVAQEVWEAERVCPDQPPCAEVFTVTAFDYEPGGRRSSGQHYVTFLDPQAAGGERELPYDIGLVGQRRAEFRAGTQVWILDDEVIGLVEGGGKRWVDFAATSQDLFLAVAVGLWGIAMGLVSLAWVPQSWRWHLASPRTPGLAMLRWLTAMVGIAAIVPVLAAFARVPLWGLVPLAAVTAAVSGWFWTRAWWAVWTVPDRGRWLRHGRTQRRPRNARSR